jgi:hypothetical protein
MQLALTVNCGETTCASEPGKFCHFIGARKFGQAPVCTLFPDDSGTSTFLKDKDGWVQRCPACLKAEVTK